MVLTKTPICNFGQKANSFKLTGTDGKIHKHESFLLGHIGNCIGLSPEKIVNIIKSETKGDEKSAGWLSWLFG